MLSDDDKDFFVRLFAAHAALSLKPHAGAEAFQIAFGFIAAAVGRVPDSIDNAYDQSMGMG